MYYAIEGPQKQAKIIVFWTFGVQSSAFGSLRTEKVDWNCCGHVLAAFAAVFNPGNILGAIPLFWLRKGPIFDQNP